MIRTAAIITSLFLFSYHGLPATAQEVSADNQAANVNVAVPDEPADLNPGLKRSIWEAYYTASLNQRYHTARAKFLSQVPYIQPWRQIIGVVIAFLGVVIPLSMLAAQYLAALREKTDSRQREILIGTKGGFYWSVAISVFFFIAGTAIGMYPATDPRVAMHDKLAREYAKLVSEWEIIRAELKTTPASEVAKDFRRLKESQEKVAASEGGDLYDEQLLRDAQADVNHHFEIKSNG